MRDTTVVKTKTCRICNKYELWVLDSVDVQRWQNGELIQDVFPKMSIDEREILITGTHGACWDKLFPKEDDNE